MRKLRLLSILLFLASIVLFGGYEIMSSRGADKLGPQISMEESSISVSVNATDKELLAGVTATDPKDGDVTDSIVIENISTFLDKGRRLISYVAFDSDNHVTKASRQLVYTDYISPRFEITGPLCFQAGTDNVQTNVRALDCIDGDITDKVKLSTDSVIYIGVAGEYNVKLQVSNSCGDVVTLPVTMEVYDRSEAMYRPMIGLSKYIVYTEAGNAIDPGSYLENVTIGEQEYALTDANESYGTDEDTGYRTVNRSRIEISDEVNYEEPGVYEIIFAMTGQDGTRGKTRMVVVVTDDETKTESEAGRETAASGGEE